MLMVVSHAPFTSPSAEQVLVKSIAGMFLV